MSFHKIDSFCIDHSERFLFAGSFGGQLLTIAVEPFEIVRSVQLHEGSIHVVAGHRELPYIATLGMDGQVCISRYESDGKISLVHGVDTRNIRAPDGFDRNLSTTQALAFHRTKRQLVGHGGNAGVFELEFDDASYRTIHCTRLHGPYDPVTARYVGSSDRVLSANVVGEVVLSEGNKKLKYWNLGLESNTHAIHWFEEFRDNQFLLASDARRVIKLDLSDDRNIKHGEEFALDHMEHVTRNSVSGRLFASGFDRKVYEIDPESLTAIRVVWHAPFKLRWIKTLENDPGVMIVNCRNGALYKIRVDTGEIVQRIKRTPDALWSGESTQGRIYLAGEGDRLRTLTPNAVEPYQNIQLFRADEIRLPVDPYFYTKRLAAHESGRVVCGRSDGKVVLVEPDGHARIVAGLESPIRDLCFAGESEIYVACEDGCVYRVRVDEHTTQTIFESKQPIWSIALNPNRSLLAIGDRIRNVVLLDTVIGKTVRIIDDARFIKRMKWRSATQLLVPDSSQLWEFDTAVSKRRIVAKAEYNTIEDFVWDKAEKYLIVLDYSKVLRLHDFSTGELLHVFALGHDYGKGLVLLDDAVNRTGYACDCVVFGRDGNAQYCRVHDEHIISFGYAGVPAVTQQ